MNLPPTRNLVTRKTRADGPKNSQKRTKAASRLFSLHFSLTTLLFRVQLGEKSCSRGGTFSRNRVETNVHLPPNQHLVTPKPSRPTRGLLFSSLSVLGVTKTLVTLITLSVFVVLSRNSMTNHADEVLFSRKRVGTNMNLPPQPATLSRANCADGPEERQKITGQKLQNRLFPPFLSHDSVVSSPTR